VRVTKLNGDGNTDGASDNRSWNCGPRGRPTRRPSTTCAPSQRICWRADAVARRPDAARPVMRCRAPSRATTTRTARTTSSRARLGERRRDHARVYANAVALRRTEPVFRRPGWLRGRRVEGSRLADSAWFRADAVKMDAADWDTPEAKTLMLFLNGEGLETQTAGVGRRVTAFCCCSTRTTSPWSSRCRPCRGGPHGRSRWTPRRRRNPKGRPFRPPAWSRSSDARCWSCAAPPRGRTRGLGVPRVRVVHERRAGLAGRRRCAGRRSRRGTRGRDRAADRQRSARRSALCRSARLRYHPRETRSDVHVPSRFRPPRHGRRSQADCGLVIPPAWTDVWIAEDAQAHLQATGRDARGRTQYRYHPRWRQARDEAKYHHMIAFARALPEIRGRVATDLRSTPLSRPWVLATVVQLLERTLIRVGNEEYARDNQSYGLTTLLDRHVAIHGRRVSFHFRAKSGIVQQIELTDVTLARADPHVPRPAGTRAVSVSRRRGTGARRRLVRRERVLARRFRGRVVFRRPRLVLRCHRWRSDWESTAASRVSISVCLL